MDKDIQGMEKRINEYFSTVTNEQLEKLRGVSKFNFKETKHQERR